MQAIIDGTSSSTLPPAQSRNEMLLIQVLNKVNELAAAASKSHVHICLSSEYNHETGVPTISSPDADTLYLVPNSGSGTDIYTEWIYANNAWEAVGGASIEIPQSDWSQNDSSAADYIKNKPTIPAAQVQADWAQTDTTAPDYIKNKPASASGVSF